MMRVVAVNAFLPASDGDHAIIIKIPRQLRECPLGPADIAEDRDIHRAQVVAHSELEADAIHQIVFQRGARHAQVIEIG